MAQYSGNKGRREELARAKGARSYSEYRKWPAARRERATARLASRNASYRKTGAAKQASAAGGKQRRHLQADLGAAGNVLVSMVDRELRAFLRRADREGNRVSVRATIRHDDPPTLPVRDRPRQEVSLYSRGGVDPSWLLALADTFGKVRDAIAEQIAAVYGLEGPWTLIEIQLLAS